MRKLVIMQKTMFIFLFIGSVCFSGCSPQINGQSNVGLPASENSPAAWIDAPLNESHLPLAPYEIVIHVSSGQAQLSLGELVINDQVAALLLVEDSAKNLATLRYLWEPDQPGKYILHTRAQTSDGEWGETASAVVYIDQGDTPTPTPEPEVLAGISNIQKDPQQVKFGSCQPNQLTISAHAQDPAGVKGLSLFYRLSDASGNLTGWLNAAMNPTGDGNYQKTINMTSTAENLGFNSQTGTFIYQLIIQNQNGEMVRSDVLRDVSVAKCEGFDVPSIRPITPILPLQIKTPTYTMVK